MADEFVKINSDSALEVADRFDLDDESKQFLEDGQTPVEFLRILIEHELYYDAVTFLAHCLDAESAIRWASACVKQHFKDSNADYQQAVQATDAWLQDPSEENRRVAETHAEKNEYATPAGWLAAAAFWSGGSIVEEGQPAVEPPTYLYAHAVAGAIVMAAGLGEPESEEVTNRYKKYLQHGAHVAKGGK